MELPVFIYKKKFCTINFVIWWCWEDEFKQTKEGEILL